MSGMGEVRHYDLDEKDTWQTPNEIVSCLDKHLDIRLDPCAGLFTFIGDINWTIEVPDRVPDAYRECSSAERYDVCIENNDGRKLACGFDSLARSWDIGDAGIAYVNPPFSMKTEFIDKTIAEYNDGNISGAVVLTPASTDVKSWWHGSLSPVSDYVWFSEGRISFVDPDTGDSSGSPPFGTALHFVGPREIYPDELFQELDEVGDVMVRYRVVA